MALFLIHSKVSQGVRILKFLDCISAVLKRLRFLAGFASDYSDW